MTSKSKFSVAEKEHVVAAWSRGTKENPSRLHGTPVNHHRRRRNFPGRERDTLILKRCLCLCFCVCVFALFLLLCFLKLVLRISEGSFSLIKVVGPTSLSRVTALFGCICFVVVSLWHQRRLTLTKTKDSLHWWSKAVVWPTNNINIICFIVCNYF